MKRSWTKIKALKPEIAAKQGFWQRDGGVSLLLHCKSLDDARQLIAEYMDQGFSSL